MSDKEANLRNASKEGDTETVNKLLVEDVAQTADEVMCGLAFLCFHTNWTFMVYFSVILTNRQCGKLVFFNKLLRFYLGWK